MKRYDFYATVMDEGVSRVALATARLKSLTRRLASRSMRCWATQCACNLISQYVPGICQLPQDLSKGALEGYKLMVKIYGCPVRPVDPRYVINHDAFGGLRTAGSQVKRNKNRTGKVSIQSLVNEYRKTSSKWTKAVADDEKFKGIGIETKEINCAAGLRGKNVHVIKGIPEDRMSTNMIVLEIEGMGGGQDMKPDSTNTGFLVFCKSKGVDDVSGDTIGTQLSEWYHSNVVLPFIELLRRTDPSFKWLPGSPIPSEMRAVLKFDGEMTYTGLLKKLRVASKDHDANILYAKVAAGYTECGQSNDMSSGFKSSQHFFKILTDVDNDKSQLKVNLNAELERLALEKKLCLTLNQRKAIVDFASIAREVDRLSNSVDTVRTGWVATGEQSKSLDGKRFYPFPDIDVMIDANKNEELKRDRTKYKAMLASVCEKIYKDGHAYESWFDEKKESDVPNYFPQDTLEDNRTIVEKKCSDNAYHQQRAMLMNWLPIVSTMRRLQNQCQQNVRDTLMKKHKWQLAQFDLNERAEEKLKSNLADGQSLMDCTIDHFLKGKDSVKKDELAAFIWLRITKHLDKPDSPYPTYNRGTTNTSGANDNGGPFLYREAWKVRHLTPTDSRPPEPEMPVADNHIPSSPPIHIRVGAEIMSGINQAFIPTPTMIDNAFECLTHLSLQGEERDTWKNDPSKVLSLRDDVCRRLLIARLSTHLSSHNEYILTPVWKWVYKHMGIGAAILKMRGMVKNDATLGKCDAEDDLFHPRYVSNHEMFTAETKTHHGSYLALDLSRGYFVRAGSAAVGCMERTEIGHPKGSRQSTSSDQRSKFYSCYPDKTSEHVIEEIRKGWFTDIQFSPGIIFSEDNKGKVQNLFEWDAEITAYLHSRLGRGTAPQELERKKHRMVCYFFETVLELCLAPRHNVSTSLGFEAFIVKIGQAYGDEWLIQMRNDDDDDDDDVTME